MAPKIYLDISRLLSAGWRTTPSGIERVELAYAKQFKTARNTRFVVYFLGKLHFIPYRLIVVYIETLENVWRRSSRNGRVKATAGMVFIYMMCLAIALRSFLPRPAASRDNCSVYLNLSHQNLDAGKAISDFKRRTGAKLLFFVHDLIPIVHPEFARPGQSAVHRRRMDTVAALADSVVVNSAAIRDDFLRYRENKPSHAKVHVAHLGIEPTGPAVIDDGEAAVAPYFLMLATIEPRKNHLLLLNLWRRFIAENGTAPRLIIAGRRGWENEMVLDMLERCGAILEFVEERRDLRDDELGGLMRGARALLLPSFAEGYGLPVAEALAAGTPVICSDLPALREIGGDVPEYIDPLDGPAWARAILDYAEAFSPRREAQCERLLSWSAPRWERHFELVSAILQDLMSAERRVDETVARRWPRLLFGAADGSMPHRFSRNGGG